MTPLAALIVNVCISTAITFGQTRYRSSAEVALVLMATAGFVGLAEKYQRRRGTLPAGEASTALTASEAPGSAATADPDRARV